MNRLDGNALAGPLADLLGHDLTDAEGRCAGCGRVAVLALAAVYVTAMGTVVRCSGCGAVLAVLACGEGGRRVTLSGLTALEVPGSD